VDGGGLEGTVNGLYVFAECMAYFTIHCSWNMRFLRWVLLLLEFWDLGFRLCSLNGV